MKRAVLCAMLIFLPVRLDAGSVMTATEAGGGATGGPPLTPCSAWQADYSDVTGCNLTGALTRGVI